MGTRYCGTSFRGSLGFQARRGLRRLLAGLGYAADLLGGYRQPSLALVAGPSSVGQGGLATRQWMAGLLARGRRALTGSRRRHGAPNTMYLDALEQRQLFSVFQISGVHNSANASDFQLALSTDSASIQSWSVNWNDGSPVQTLTGSARQTDHVYADASEPTVTVAAVDYDGTHILALVPASSIGLADAAAATQGQYTFAINTDANGSAFLGSTTVTDPALVGAALMWAQQQITAGGGGAYQQYTAQITIPAQGEYEYMLSPVPQASGGGLLSGGHSANYSEDNGYGGTISGVTRERWDGQASVGNSNWDNLSALGTPTTVDTVSNFESDGYGGNAIVDMSACLTPPEDGYYTFTINSDYGGDLYLSTDASPNDEQLIASFTNGNSGAGSAQSQPIFLSGGQTYYIESI